MGISSGCKILVPQKGGVGRSISTVIASERRVSISVGMTSLTSPASINWSAETPISGACSS